MPEIRFLVPQESFHGFSHILQMESGHLRYLHSVSKLAPSTSSLSTSVDLNFIVLYYRVL